MSSRWPQGQQDQRSPFATYDEDWPQDSGGAPPWPDAGWQDTGWQDPDPGAYPGQWAPADGTAQPGTPADGTAPPGTPAVAEPWASDRQDYPGQPYAAPDRPQATRQRDDHAEPYQQEWNQAAGGFGDDADYEWFQYLGQGRSAPAKPDAVAAPPPGAARPGQRGSRQRDRDKASRRGGARSERPRSRRGHGRPAPPGPGPGWDAPADLGLAEDGPADPGFAQPAAAAPPVADLGWSEPAAGGRHALTDREYGQPVADPELDRPAAGRHGLTDPGYGWAGAPDAPRHAPPEAAGWAAVPEAPGYAPPEAPGWPAAPDMPRYASPEAAGWADGPEAPGFASPEAPAWAAVPDVPGHASPEASAWAAVPDAPGYAPPEAPAWAAVPDVPGHAPPEAPAWAAAPDVPGHAPPEAPLWAEAPDAPGFAPPEAAGWAAAPVAAEYAPPEAPGWAEAAGQPESAGWPVAADPEYGTLAPADPGPDSVASAGPRNQRTGARRGNRAGSSRGPRRAVPGVKTREARPRQARGHKPVSAEAGSIGTPIQDGPRPRARPAPGRQPARQAERARSPRKTRGRLSWPVLALAGASAVAVGAVVVFVTSSGGGAAHVLTTPASLGPYVKQPQLAAQMQAATLRQQILQQSAGEANNVIYAVYEDSTGPAAASGPQIFLFIGGNLKGTSAGAFISTFTGKVPDAQTTSAGSLGGAAACFPSVNGRLAGCVWADDDTFGLVASQTLSSSGLANEMRQMRPMVEHQVSSSQ